MDMISGIAKEVGISDTQAKQSSEILLEHLHRRLVEYQGLNGDYIGEQAHYDLSDKGFYHLLGLFEQFSKKYEWESGIASEYLGRLPPVERWKTLTKEIREWDWDEK